MPAKISMGTSPDGSNNPVTNLAIDSDRAVVVGELVRSPRLAAHREEVGVLEVDPDGPPVREGATP